MIGLLGAHGTGKTTLATEFAKRNDIPAVLTTISGIYHSLGLDPAIDYPIHVRIGAQEAILLGLERQWSGATKLTPLFITDRTPLDLAAYMLADIQRATLADQREVGQLVNDYVDRCFAALNRWFSTVLLLQPGIPVAEGRVGKAPACPAYMEHLNSLMRGLLADQRVEVKGYVIGRQFLSMEDRLKCVQNAFKAAFHCQTEEVAQLKAAGGHLH